ncbi:MAG: arsenate reductase (glutaredoxin) [Euryarchaeota archaeon]|nr:arsenate reductase (glutaredoxin) [Euryarchaeota archaeon]
MTRKIRLYHNPRCSKSRKAFQLLMDQNIEFEDYRYLNIGVDIDDIEILSKLHGILRPNKNHELADFTIEQIQKELKKHPENLQRPILIVDDKAVIGRPPEKILTLLL